MQQAMNPMIAAKPIRLQDRILATAKNNRTRVLLADDSSEFTGALLVAYFEQFHRMIRRFAPLHGRVGILLDNSAAKAYAILAVISTGRVPVILNPTESQETIEGLLPRMQLHTMIVGEEIYRDLNAASSVIRMDSQGEIRSTQVNRISTTPPLPRPGTALILYTSGSMGEPKGVEVSEQGLLYSTDLLISHFGLTHATVAPILLPICHSMAMNTQFLPTFLAGGKCVFFESALGLGRVYRNIANSGGDFVALIGEILRLCWEERKRRNLPPALNVKHIQLAGGIIRAEHLKMAREIFPNAVIHKGYGLTEGIRVSMIDSRDPNFLSDNAGYVLAGQEIEVRSSGGRVLPPGTMGHIYLRGPNVMLGYDNQPDFPMEEGWMKTGDMGVLTIDRRLIIQGRSDSIFKVQGKRVSAKEIERVALDASRFVRDVKVMPVEDAKTGARPVLFLEIAQEKAKAFMLDGRDEFEKSLKEHLSHKSSLPKDVFILHSFPRTYNGKLKSAALSQIWADKDKAEPGSETQSQGFSFHMVPPGGF